MWKPTVLAVLCLSLLAHAAPKAKRITVDVKNADVHDVLRMFAHVSKLNIVTSDDVRGQVTLSLRNVPWTEALDVVLASKGLGVEKRGSVLRVAPLSTLIEEAKGRAALAQSREDEAPLVTRFIPVNYARASDLAPHVQAQLSKRGKVAVDERTNTLIVTDVETNVVRL